MSIVKILGVKISNLTNQQMINSIVQDIDEKKKRFIITANPEILSYAQNNKDYLAVLQKADTVTADGIGVVKGAKLLGQHIPERVTGIDMFMGLLNIANEKNYSIYLLGAADHVIKNTVETIHRDFPNICITGSYHGFFETTKEMVLVEEIKRKKPDLVFVALGAPKQEEWISRNLKHFEKGIFIGVGGSFDVLSGEVKRAPMLWQKSNLEWFYRFLKNPSRWRRTLRLPVFILQVLKQRKGDSPELEKKEEQSL